MLLELPESKQVCTHSVPSRIYHTFYTPTNCIQRILSHARGALAYALDPLSHLWRKVLSPLLANLSESLDRFSDMIVKMGSPLAARSEQG